MSAESIAPTTPSSQTSCCEPTCCSDSASEASPNSNSGADTQNGQTPLDPQLASTSTTEAPRADTPEEIRRAVREGYGQIARGQTQSCCGPSESCSGPEDGAESLARGVGYDEAELANLPDGANMGLSCGNPTALAQLAPGETVLDLGSGGGFDVFIAGEKVGATGRSIGVDMTADMLEKARGGIAIYAERTGLSNVEFRLGEIEHLPVEDHSVDVVISNCVINLSPNKAQVWREIARVLKPGGRVAVSDLALKRMLPQDVRDMVEALVGCVAGAVLVSETQQMAQDAGLTEIELEPRDRYIESMADWHDPLYSKILDHLPENTTPGDFVTSLAVSARKPQS
jgi:arsenite methyltransferase